MSDNPWGITCGRDGCTVDAPCDDCQEFIDAERALERDERESDA